MTAVHVTNHSRHVPGDLRALGRGDEVVLHPDAPSRPDWSALLCAFPVAIGRGASVKWTK
ncbi:hypothetical protein SAMN02982929_07190 [Saccharopolyspora kobensis]|uniref:Uncharacterized protein n=1 Tax=Saccharopolyspora kobensis TaxID=146035 RepID=A0A1H6ELG8_9PSEU|nr:hypothetical protein [Saccharopolyspora kobensis]SEG98702.1 hypothetical protein SAMN02982929_07190 [Saccharopolyspora kobensis]SFD23684.1 hypothetical protein SAMN05216506_103179 [Saccharopolyspora kobensis]